MADAVAALRELGLDAEADKIAKVREQISSTAGEINAVNKSAERHGLDEAAIADIELSALASRINFSSDVTEADWVARKMNDFDVLLGRHASTVRMDPDAAYERYGLDLAKVSAVAEVTDKAGVRVWQDRARADA